MSALWAQAYNEGQLVFRDWELSVRLLPQKRADDLRGETRAV
jgi:hypothetical protein